MTTEAAPIKPSDYLPISPEVRRDPYPYYEAMRRQSPVHQVVPGMPFYALTRYEEVAHALHHPEQFSSTAFREISQGSGATGPGGANAQILAGHRILDAPMLIAVDPPEHGRMRRIVNRGFTPRRIAALEPRIRELADLYLDKALVGDRFDLQAGLAIPLPVTVIAELLGIEPGRRDEFKHWSDCIVFGLSGLSSFERDEVRRAADEMEAYFEGMIEDRRRSPCDDLISVLVAAEEGEALSADEVMTFCVLLLIAGNETTTNLIGNAMKALLQHPEQLAEVQADPALIPGMLEEAVRYESPVQGIPRLTTGDVEFEAGTIPKDSRVMVLIASANRDSARFPDPDRFDIHRNPQGHLGFGHGIHFCLGAALARLEARIAFEELFRRATDFRLETREIVPHDSLLVRGPRELEISFRLH